MPRGVYERARIPLAVRFWRKVRKAGPDDCWLWQGAVVKANGHGHLRVDRGHTVLAHRLSWEMEKGSLDADAVLCHRCDTPRCVNPGHLFVGTQQVNVADMVAKGRNSKPPVRRRLSPEDVAAIRRARQMGTPLKTLAARFAVHHTTILRAARATTQEA
jgi:hypothetical protein